jgi:hypothetical protein
MYDAYSKKCLLLEGAGCSNVPWAQHCTKDAECVPEGGSQPGRCRCLNNLDPNKERLCFLSYGKPCDREGVMCDPSAYLTCGSNHTCICRDPSSWYEPNLNECLISLNQTCSVEGQRCGKNAHCEDGLCACDYGYESSEDGNCLRSYGTYCFDDVSCNAKNKLECIGNRCTCKPGYIPTGVDNSTAIRCLGNYQQSCHDIPCSPSASLNCIHGICNCLSPGEQVFESPILKCGSLVGNRCHNYPTGDAALKCISNGYCDNNSTYDAVYGVCACEEDYKPEKGLCVSSAAYGKDSRHYFLAIFTILVIQCI